MKRNKLIFLSVLVSLITALFLPRMAFAFGCTSAGIGIGGTGSFTIPITVTLSKTSNEIILTDMSTYTTCSGQTGYMDALRLATGTGILSSQLTALGYSGFISNNGITAGNDFPLGIANCVWPQNASNCTEAPSLAPLRVKIGMRRGAVMNSRGITIPAGTEIATFAVDQRSVSTWGWRKTWHFVLAAPLVIPGYTCQIDNPEQTVELEGVRSQDLINHGAGTYPDKNKNFTVDLTCDQADKITMQFDGTTMAGHADVLANTQSGNNAVGIQVLFNGTPIKYGEQIQVKTNPSPHESLAFDAHYFYSGGQVNAGPVGALATMSFTYN